MLQSAASPSLRAPKRGRETPRVFTPPLRPLTRKTSLGPFVIEFAENKLGIELFPWQKWLLLHMLELLPDNNLRFRTVLVMVGRQNGKTTLSQVLALWFMYEYGARLVLGTAQDIDTAEAVWQGAVNMITETDPDTDEPIRPQLLERFGREVRSSSSKSLVLTTGEQWKVKAANRRSARSLSGNIILLDELREHQDWDAWSAITHTTMAQALALILAFSNAGDTTSVVLQYLRRQAHSVLGDPDGICKEGPAPEGDEDDSDDEDLDAGSLGFFEWSALPSAHKRDWSAIAQANPSLGHIKPMERNIRGAMSEPPWSFKPEVLCQWVDNASPGPFPDGAWEASLDAASKIIPTSPRVWGLDVSWNRSTAHIGVAGWRRDGDAHAEHVKAMRPDEVVAWFEAKPIRKRYPVVIQQRGAPASSLIQGLRDIGCEVIEWGGPELGKGCGLFYDGIRVGVDPQIRDGEGNKPRRVWHLEQPLLTAAAASAAVKAAGDGVWLWDRAHSPTDIAPLVAVTGAYWWLATMPPPKKPAPPPALVSASPRAPVSGSARGEFNPATASF